MTNLIKSLMKCKSIALKTDAHLSSIISLIEIRGKYLVVNEYTYVDYEVVQGGAIFYFVPYEKWLDDSWDNEKDCKEIYCEFEDQRFYSTEYDYHRGIIQSERYKLIDNMHEYFNLDEALQDAELKAYEKILNISK